MSKEKKIIIAADIFPPMIGGPATYSLKLANELARRGWQVKLICYSEKREKDDYGFPVFRIIQKKSTIGRYLRYFLKLLFLARDSEIIYAMGPVSAGLPAKWAAKILRKKLVVKVVGDYAWEQARNLKVTNIGIDDFQSKEFSGKIGQLKKIQSQACQAADQVVTPSAYLKKIVSGWGIEPEKITVIFNSFTPTTNLQPVAKENKLLVSVGRLVPWKGFDVLIEAVAELIGAGHDFRLTIYGQGPEKESLENKIRKLDLSDRIKIEFLPHDYLLAKLAAAEMFVLNTGYEGLPHTFLEAMNARAPIIATQICGNPEVVTTSENGILIEYNNREELKAAILKLDQDPALRERFVAKSNEVLKKFEFAPLMDQVENLFLSL